MNFDESRKWLFGRSMHTKATRSTENYATLYSEKTAFRLHFRRKPPKSLLISIQKVGEVPQRRKQFLGHSSEKPNLLLLRKRQWRQPTDCEDAKNIRSWSYSKVPFLFKSNHKRGSFESVYSKIPFFSILSAARITLCFLLIIGLFVAII